jgi:large subunit ribosomal protein L35Ae
MTETIRPHRLYAKGRITGHTRGKRNSKEHTTLVDIEGARTAKDAEFYLGKRIAFVYRAKRVVDGSRIRVIWGRVTRTHGTSGAVRTKFASNIPPKAFGAAVRIVRSFWIHLRCSTLPEFKSHIFCLE